MTGLVRYMVTRTPRQVALLSGFLVAASVTEGISVLLLVPILKLIDPSHPNASLAIPTGPLNPWLGATISMNLASVLLFFVMAVTLRAVLMRYKDIYNAAFLYDLSNRLRDDLFVSVANARWAFLSRLRGSDINHALTADIDRVQLSASQFFQLFQTIVVLAVYTGIAFLLSPMMTGFALAIGALVMLLLSPIRQMALRYGGTLTSQRQEQYRIVTEFLTGLKIAKASNIEQLYVDQLSHTLQTMRGSTIHFMRIYTIGTLFFQVATAAGLGIFVYVAVGRFTMPYSSIIALILLFVRIGPRVAAIHGSVQSVLTNLPALSAMLDLRDSCDAHAEVRVPGNDPAPAFAKDVEFNNVTFSYPGESEKQVLSGISFTIKANEITAIVGPSGSGKSTLADVLMGLLEPGGGSILIDGVPLTMTNRRGWRNHLAYVPQDSFLLHDSIAANLAVGRPDLTEPALWLALEAADAAAFVSALPRGLQTVVGDRGVRLSGGERQRIALARALLRRPRLLILDEATSALDWESQAAIAKSIRNLRGQLTVVTIAHRPSMIAFADWVVTIGDGKIVTSGAFAEMAQAKDGYLRRVLDGDR
jgi:ATP-binding cassette subfamily C protein